MSSGAATVLFATLSTRGDFEYLVEKELLILVGLSFAVEAGINIFLDDYYNIFPLARSLLMYWKAFGALKMENIPSYILFKKDETLYIHKSQSLEQCKVVRASIWRMVTNLKHVSFPNFEKKYCTHAIPFICGFAQDIDVHLPIISQSPTIFADALDYFETNL